VKANPIADAVLRACYAVHGELGAGQSDDAYIEALANQLTKAGLKVERRVPILLPYDGQYVDTGHYIDLVVGRSVAIDIAEATPVSEETRIDFGSHLQLAGYGLGFVLDFRVASMAEGVHTVTR
jgi:GxxExxY protein